MPQTIIFALLAVSVFCKANSKLKSTGDYYLRWGNNTMGHTTFLIRDYWGKEDEIKKFFSDKPQTRVKIDFKNWEKDTDV